MNTLEQYYLGEGKGVLFIRAGNLDQWDPQKDMLNNLIGGLIGVALYYPFRNKHPKIKKKTH